MRGFVKSYKEKQSENPNNEISTVPQKKRGRHTLLPDEIDKKVMEMASNMRLSGAVVNYNILIAIAKGIVVANDRTSLKEYGGTITFSWKWCESVFRRMKWTKRKCTTEKAVIAPGLIREIGFTFLSEVSEIVQAHKIPPQLIINIDQTPLPFVLVSKYTMNKKGDKRVSILGTNDYRQITGTFAVAMAGTFLPIQLIYKGSTNRCHPNYNFLKDFHITHTSNHWANESTSLDFLNEILIPYVNRMREELAMPHQPWLLIADVFKGQWTGPVKDLVRQSNGKMSAIPNNWTNYYQPLDLSVNKPCKDFLRNEAQSWYSEQIIKQISIVKPLHAKWITKFYDYIRSKPEIVRNGWEKSKITECIKEKMKLDPFADV